MTIIQDKEVEYTENVKNYLENPIKLKILISGYFDTSYKPQISNLSDHRNEIYIFPLAFLEYFFLSKYK